MMGRIKRDETKYVDIDRHGPGAEIVPFAQKEMVKRFLDGIDNDYNAYLLRAMTTALKAFDSEIFKQHVKGTEKPKQGIYSKLDNSASKFVSSFADKARQRRQENYRQKILDMVHFMPKQDLANLAESLVDRV